MYNFQTICRTCSSDDNLQLLFDNNYPFNIAEMLSEIANITVIWTKMITCLHYESNFHYVLLIYR